MNNDYIQGHDSQHAFLNKALKSPVSLLQSLLKELHDV